MSIQVNTFAGGGRLELPVPGHQRRLNRRGFLNRENDVWVQTVAGRVDGETVVAARDHFVEQSAHPKRFTLFMDNAKIHHGGTFQAHLDRGLLHKNFSLPGDLDVPSGFAKNGDALDYHFGPRQQSGLFNVPEN